MIPSEILIEIIQTNEIFILYLVEFENDKTSNIFIFRIKPITMKFLKTLLIIVVVLAAIIAILSFVAPTKMSATRSVVINAPKEVVWNNVSRFDNMQKWT